MNRKAFIEREGAGCKNWTWSWSFINHEKKEVLFGAFDVHELGDEQLILSPDWQVDKQGRKKPGFSQAVEHIDYIKHSGYCLKTFRQVEKPWNEETGTVTITSFDPVLEARLLLEKDDGWYAALKEYPEDTSLTIQPKRTFLIEGQKVPLTSIGVERNQRARDECIEKYGLQCVVCDFDFSEAYGDAGHGFIHVHHLKPLAKSDGPRIVDPIKHLRLVCANCHAIIHRGPKLRSIKKMRKLLKRKTCGDSPSGKGST